MAHRLNDIELLWDGPAGTTFLEDMNATASLGQGLQASLLATRKTTTLGEQIGASGVAAALLPTVEQQPLLTGVIAVVLLAAVSPISLDIVSDDESHFLGIIEKLRTGYFVDEGRLRALLAIDPLADKLIESLCEKNLLRCGDTGKLIIQRKILANIKIM